MDNDARYNTDQAAEIIGMPPSTLDALVRRGIVKPTQDAKGTGKVRRWSLTDLVATRIGLEWADKGVDWRAVARVVQHIAKNGLEAVEEYPYIAVAPGGQAKALPKDTPIGELVGQKILLCDLRPCVATMRKRAERFAKTKKSKRRPNVAART